MELGVVIKLTNLIFAITPPLVAYADVGNLTIRRDRRMV